ncbi:Vinorine synthase-like [Quillaja saponaria]|uniref:Vinorine synthase-like n=1 Tax=Quillaja saponaria TaxID=32244 RepID=A0AAD7L2U8_QUISA|nr:Vinorine synthase-like [Quillaja saponaria]
MKVNIISRNIIKPCIPTPLHLRTYKLSILDQLAPSFHSTLILFYQSNSNQKDNHNIASQFLEKSHHLQDSLSKTLVNFYPFAGQVRDSSTIDCNDHGAYFVEAQINCQLIDFLSKPEPENVLLLSPTTDPKSSKVALDYVLLVQLTAFNCGSFAIAVSASHKINDASSLFTFIQGWTSVARRDAKLVVPELNYGASFLPPREIQNAGMKEQSLLNPGNFHCITKRFVFNATKIAALKAKIASAMEHGQHSPSSVDALTALLFKSAMAANRSISGSPFPTVLHHATNLRARMNPPLPANAIGNLIRPSSMLFKGNETELHELVANIRKQLAEFNDEMANKLKGDEGSDLICRLLMESGGLLSSMTNMTSTSLCQLPLYNLDFGWGNPVWVTSPLYLPNVILLLRTKQGDAIEAWITLEENVMALVERDEELLAFASLNPSAFPNHSRL